MKKEMRQRFRDVLARLTADEVRAKSAAAAHHLFECPEFTRAQTVMVFISLPTEVDTSPILLRSWQDHKRVLAPRISWDQRKMLPIEIRSLTDDLVETRMGLREPVSGVPASMNDIDLVLVPGLGFDEFGNRLGRGQGFYDQFLSSPEFHGVACALVFEEQITDMIPVGPLDRPVHMLVSDQRVRHFAAK
ncbi:MAG: 5-formyltetrahydrofolate cyclo-ligase [Phycisphaerales bacterium]|nr:5-formyltetrahydrofolate cyclo-ligase [Phycisphaerales bacterium]